MITWRPVDDLLEEAESEEKRLKKRDEREFFEREREAANYKIYTQYNNEQIE